MQIFSIIVALLTQVGFVYVWSNFLPPEEVGYIALVSIVTTFGMMLSTLGVTNYIIYKGEKNNPSFYYTLNVFMFSVGCAVFLLIGLLSLLSFFSGISKGVVISFFVSSLMFPVIGLGITSQGQLIKEKKLNEIAKAEILSKLFALICFFLMVSNGGESYHYFVSQVILWFVRYMIIIKLANKDLSCFNSVFDKSVILEVIPYVKSLIGAQVLNTSSNKVDEVMLSYIFGVEFLGVYFSFKQVFQQFFSMLYNFIKRLFLPYFVEDKGEFFRWILCCTSLFVVFVCITSILLDNILISILFSIEDKNYLYLFLFSIVVVSSRYLAGNLQTAYYQVKGLPLEELKWNVIQFLLLALMPSLLVLSFNLTENDFMLMISFFSAILCFLSLVFFKMVRGYSYFIIIPFPVLGFFYFLFNWIGK